MARNWRTVLAKVRAAGAGSGAATLASITETLSKAHVTELSEYIKSTYPLAEDLADYTEQWQASVRLH